MRCVFRCLFAALLLATPSAAGSVFLLADSGESLTLECRDNGLYFGYQIDGLSACSRYDCMTIQVRVDRKKWVNYSAHNGSSMGFVRNTHDRFRRNGDEAEALLKKMVTASTVEFRTPQTKKSAEFPITTADARKLQSIAKECGQHS